MNKIIFFLKTGDTFMVALHLKQYVITIVLVDHLLNILREFKNLEKQEI